MVRTRCLAALLVLLPALAALAGATQWSPGTFPNPKTDVDKCGRGGVPSNICDPDLVLSSQGKDYVEGVLKAIWAGDNPYKQAECGGRLQGYQVAVAVMRKMEVPAASTPAAASQAFAKALHDQWGVGDPACNNGVLLLLSVEDRQVYISTGRGAAGVLNGARIDSIVSDMRPGLRKGDYDAAVQLAVVEIGLGLAGGRKGRSDEGGGDWFGYLFFGIMAFVVGKAGLQSFRKRREYRDCRRMLAKLKREQENLRSHAWSLPQSCPICLEDFTVHPGGTSSQHNHGSGSGGGGKGANDDTASSSGGGGGVDAEAGPSTSLLHSHSGSANGEEAFFRMSQAGQAAVRRLRQRRRGAGTAGDGPSTGPGGSSSGGGWQDGAGPSTSPAGGSGGAGDGGSSVERLPVTLGCGHTFCEPCIEKWLDKGTTCPVCRRPISEGSQQEGGNANTNNANEDQQHSSWQQQQRQRLADDWLATDLAFRLGVLQNRYPAYITPTMVDTWRSEAQTTGSFNWESHRDFQLRDPGARHHYESSGHGGFGASFGGGSGFGGGGGGGSW